jgi:hypothetical protein
MFCPSCGAEYTIELKYCNRCGANLSSPESAEVIVGPVDVTKSVVAIGTTMTVLTLGGFVALIAGAIALASKASMGNDPIIALVMMGMITILISDVFLARQLSKLISASLSSPKPPKVKRAPALAAAAPAQLRQSQPPQLQRAPSVTENTTRLFEPAYREPSVDDPALARKLDR